MSLPRVCPRADWAKDHGKNQRKEVQANQYLGWYLSLDNARFHRKSILTKLAEKKNCHVLFLPPYSPDLNPIEKRWAWLKDMLRAILHEFDSFDAALRYVFQVG